MDHYFLACIERGGTERQAGEVRRARRILVHRRRAHHDLQILVKGQRQGSIRFFFSIEQCKLHDVPARIFGERGHDAEERHLVLRQVFPIFNLNARGDEVSSGVHVAVHFHKAVRAHLIERRHAVKERGLGEVGRNQRAGSRKKL